MKSTSETLKKKNAAIINDRQTVENMKSESIRIAQIQTENQTNFLAEKSAFEEYRKAEIEWINTEKERIDQIFEENENLKVCLFHKTLDLLTYHLIYAFQAILHEEKTNFENYRAKMMTEISKKQDNLAHQSQILINEQEKWKSSKVRTIK